MIEAAYRQASRRSGPLPNDSLSRFPLASGRPTGPVPAEYVCAGTAKHLRLFHPASAGQGGSEVLHPWLEAELTAILATLPEPEVCSFAENRRWEGWQEGLSMGITLPESLPPRRILLVLDNLIGHYRVDFVLWLFAHGIMPLYNAPWWELVAYGRIDSADSQAPG